MRKPLIVLSLLLGVACSGDNITEDYTAYVDPMIGSGGHGHVFVGANVPFGAVQLGPTSIPQSWDWTSGYHISDTTVIGFTHTHLNGTGIGDLSDIVLMPVVGAVTYARGTNDDPHSGLWSYFSRKNERVAPGYYATRLDRYGVDVELTATERVGVHKYTFSEGDSTAIVLDLENGTCWDAPVETYVTVKNQTTIAGYRRSKGWAADQRVFFVAEFSQPIASVELIEQNKIIENATEAKGTGIYARLNFDLAKGQEVLAKVAISPVSIENAALNMNAECSDWDFDAVVATAKRKWNAELSKVKIETSDSAARRIFYTALYHTMVAPSLFCDVNGDYRGSDGENYRAADFVNYTTFSLWDTYRAAMPLMTIIHPEKMNDIAHTMVSIYDQQGKLPVWHLMGNETDCMVGNPGIAALADAVLKGYYPDKQKALKAMVNSAMLDERGMSLLKRYGYIPCDSMLESVAISMEYALADWSVAQVAKNVGDKEQEVYFTERSKAYKHYFDPSDRFMKGKDSKGEFRRDFNPIYSPHRESDYCEGNAWQYTWLVPHDLPGLIELFSGQDQFISKLDSLFTVSSDLGDNTSPDISGLIGQYAHGNEPSHHILYFYTMIGQPWKTAEKVREVLTTLYHDRPDGLSGNEDVGQMSAWYILSSMGFYQVEPAGGKYYFGSPLFDRMVLNVKDGKTLEIVAHNNSAQNIYIQSVSLNGKPYTAPYIDFADIAAGGKLEFQMGNTSGIKWY